MRVFNLRLTDEQFNSAQQIAQKQSQPMSQILREAINQGLNIMSNFSDNFINESGQMTHVSAIPKYEILATSTSVETLILLQKFIEKIEKTAPELIKIAGELAKKQLNDADPTKIIKT